MFNLTLAAVDASMSQTVLWVGIPIQMIFNMIVGYIAWRFKHNASLIQSLEARVHETTDKLIDARMRAMTHEVNGHVQGLITAVDELKAKLRDDAVVLNELGESDHALELKMLQQVFQMQLEIQKSAATKSDLKEHETSMRREMTELRNECRRDGR